MMLVHVDLFSPLSQSDTCVSGVWVLSEHVVTIIPGTCATDCFQNEQNIRQHHYAW